MVAACSLFHSARSLLIFMVCWLFHLSSLSLVDGFHRYLAHRQIFHSNRPNDGNYNHALHLKRLNNDMFIKNLKSTASNYKNPHKNTTTAGFTKFIGLDAQNQIAIILNQEISSMPGSNFVWLVHSLGLLQHQKQCSLSQIQINQILQTIPRTIVLLSPSDISILLLGLSRMHVSYNQLISIAADFPVILSRAVGKIGDERKFGDMLWSLGSMGTKWTDLPKQLRVSIIQGFDSYHDSFNKYTHSSSLWALARMGVRWDEISTLDQLPLRILRKANQHAALVSPQQSSKMLWSLGTLGCKFNQLPLNLLKMYLKTTVKATAPIHVISSIQSLTGLAKLGIHWKDLSPSMRDIVWRHVKAICLSSSAHSVTTCVWALGTLAASGSDQPSNNNIRDTMLETVAKTMHDCRPKQFCNLIWGIARMSYEWCDLPMSLRTSIQMNVARLAPDMNSIDLAVLSWSFGVLQTPLDKFPIYVVKAYFDAALSNIGQMKSQELARLIWGFSGSGIVWDDLPTAIQW